MIKSKTYRYVDGKLVPVGKPRRADRGADDMAGPPPRRAKREA